eukprot:g924.t1
MDPEDEAANIVAENDKSNKEKVDDGYGSERKCKEEETEEDGKESDEEKDVARSGGEVRDDGAQRKRDGEKNEENDPIKNLPDLPSVLDNADIQAKSLERSLARHDSASAAASSSSSSAATSSSTPSSSPTKDPTQRKRIDPRKVEEEEIGSWKRRDKQVFILTSAGKPVFMRYGSESELVGLMGVIQAVVGRCQAGGADLNQIVMKRRRFVFLLDGPLYLVAICRTDEPQPYLRRQLVFLKQQILQLLSAQIYKMLEKRPNYDFRSLMGDMRRFMEGILTLADETPHILCETFSYLPLARSDRSKIGSILMQTRKRSPKLLFGVLLSGSQVVSYVEPRGMPLPTNDMILIINFVQSSASLSSDSAVHFTPVCLPTFNGGFLQTYVGVLKTDLCLLLFSMTNDPTTAFPELTRCKDFVNASMKKSGLHDAIAKSRRDMLVTPVAELGIPELVHFICVYRGHCSQHFCPEIHPEWSDASSKKRLWERYQELYTRFQGHAEEKDEEAGSGSRDTKNHWICDRNDDETIVCTRMPQYELYATFRPLVSISVASSHAGRIMKWIKTREGVLFSQSTETWPK